MLYDEEDAAATTPEGDRRSETVYSLLIQLSLLTLMSAILIATNAEHLLMMSMSFSDGTDNFAVRFLINDVSIKLGIPWIYGGAVASRGVSLTILPGQTPCLALPFLTSACCRHYGNL